MSQVNLMRAAGKAMQHYQHRLIVVRADTGKLLVRIVNGPRRQAFASPIMRLYDKVDGEGSNIRFMIGLEDFALVIDGLCRSFITSNWIL